MTPAEHYAEAVRLLDDDLNERTAEQRHRRLLRAQVHATLASCDPARVQPQPHYVWDTPSPAGPPEGENP